MVDEWNVLLVLFLSMVVEWKDDGREREVIIPLEATVVSLMHVLILIVLEGIILES